MIQRYQNQFTARLERDSVLRLLEISAASILALAGMIHASFQPEMDIFPDHLPTQEDTDTRGMTEFSRFTIINRDDYVHFKNYPRGLLDVVGYWAESQVFGGVLLFDRSESGSQVRWRIQASDTFCDLYLQVMLIGNRSKVPSSTLLVIITPMRCHLSRSRDSPV